MCFDYWNKTTPYFRRFWGSKQRRMYIFYFPFICQCEAPLGVLGTKRTRLTDLIWGTGEPWETISIFRKNKGNINQMKGSSDSRTYLKKLSNCLWKTPAKIEAASKRIKQIDLLLTEWFHCSVGRALHCTGIAPALRRLEAASTGIKQIDLLLTEWFHCSVGRALHRHCIGHAWRDYLYYQYTRPNPTNSFRKKMFKDGAYCCYCAYVLRISRY